MKITWKKLLTLSLAAVMALSLAACGGNDSSADDQNANQTQEEAAPPADTAENAAAPESSGDGAEAADVNVLVVYYSASGNTETAANYIAQATGGDIFEITPAEPYTTKDMKCPVEKGRDCRGHEDESLRDVELTTTQVENWDSYDTVFLGYPIWWGIAAWPVDGFVEANDFSGKTVIPFCTSSSSGLGQSGELLAQLAGTGDWQEGQRFRSSASQEDVNEWVDSLGLSAA